LRRFAFYQAERRLPFVIIQPRRIRESLKIPASIGVDLLVLVVVGGIVGALFSFGKELAAPSHHIVEIDLSLWALPKYTLFSLTRGFAAYGLSLLFTLVYGSVAAHYRRAEKIMIPALDILQSLPVLTFLPGLVLAMTHLFPARQLGLEIACVVMIFTGQAWNMAFSYYSSVRQIPQNMREVAAVNRLDWWGIFRMVELPASMIGLVWNSMMSFAGGWFVLNVTEAFTMNNQNFQLPGLGSYMAQANQANNHLAQCGGIAAMVLMIVAVDQLFWRPIVVWSERFKVEETAQSERPQSWFLSMVQHSLLYPWLIRQMHQARQRAAERLAARKNAPAAKPAATTEQTAPSPRKDLVLTSAIWFGVAALGIGTLWGAWQLLHLLLDLPLRGAPGDDWVTVLLALLASFGRVLAALVLGTVWALPAGVLIGLSPKWSQRLQPIVQVLASFPANMIYLPITLVLLSLHIPFTIGCVFLMMLGTQWYVLFNVIAGAMAIPTELKEVAQVYSTPRVVRWRRIYIPGVFPHLITGLITAAGGAWNTTIVAEIVQKDPNSSFTAFGIGSIIDQATTGGMYPLEAAAAVTMALAVVVINRFMWRRLYRMAERRYSLEV
jgi:NitT/TauT family transport system permease protein